MLSTSKWMWPLVNIGLRSPDSSVVEYKQSDLPVQTNWHVQILKDNLVSLVSFVTRSQATIPHKIMVTKKFIKWCNNELEQMKAMMQIGVV